MLLAFVGMMLLDKSQHFDIDVKDIVPEYYSNNKFVKNIFFQRLEAAISLLRLVDAKSVLDAGCGDGIFAKMVKAEGRYSEIVGVDLNKNIEKLNQVYDGIKFIKADLLKLDFVEQFDVITCLDVLEHFEDIQEVLVNLESALRKDGHLIVSGPTENFFYKLGRFVTKGAFSQETGPGAGKHYWNIKQIDKVIRKRYKRVKRKKIYFFFIHLFDVNLYRVC